MAVAKAAEMMIVIGVILKDWRAYNGVVEVVYGFPACEWLGEGFDEAGGCER